MTITDGEVRFKLVGHNLGPLTMEPIGSAKVLSVGTANIYRGPCLVVDTPLSTTTSIIFN